MTHVELIADLAVRTGHTHKTIKLMLIALESAIIEALERGEPDVKLSQLGKFTWRRLPARRGRVFAEPGRAYDVPARITADFVFYPGVRRRLMRESDDHVEP